MHTLQTKSNLSTLGQQGEISKKNPRFYWDTEWEVLICCQSREDTKNKIEQDY